MTLSPFWPAPGYAQACNRLFDAAMASSDPATVQAARDFDAAVGSSRLRVEVSDTPPASQRETAEVSS